MKLFVQVLSILLAFGGAIAILASTIPFILSTYSGIDQHWPAFLFEEVVFGLWGAMPGIILWLIVTDETGGRH